MVSVPIRVVPTKKSTPTTPTVSEALAVTVVVLETVAPEPGAVMLTAGGVGSMMTLSTPEERETLPAASVAVAVMLWGPLLSVLVVMLYAPPVAEPLPTSTPSLKRRTVLPASAEPVKVGVVSVVTLSVLEPPVSEAAARSGGEGAGGGVVSLATVTVRAAEVAVLPATSRARAVRVCEPLLAVLVVQAASSG